ncbi:MAG: di-trans,poly-cis-decaprenylcistransferase [Deltaproteobacteria bacterium]|nr:di-trans,poly-cis-decaprenylcistransferase [Deltaproteobacteria bacterium]
MDGNGRWARQRGLPRVEGHRMGIRAVRAVVECARELGIPYLTLYAFSVENWGRPENEVTTLMTLLREFLLKELPELIRHRIRLNVIGEAEKLPAYVREVLDRTLSVTAGHTEMTLTLALSYAGRSEILRAAKKLAEEAARGRIAAEKLTEDDIAARLDTAGMPDPDLVIRTSGELRVSNFLLWQTAYSEFVFTDVLWPDFGKAEFLLALDEYSRRHRRFGLTEEQAEPPSGGIS